VKSLSGHARPGVRIIVVRRLLILTCAIVLVDTVFYAALVPLVPRLTEEFGLSKSAAGILSGAFGAGVLLGSAPASYLAGRAGVRPTAVGGLLLVSFASLAFGFAGEAWQLVMLRLAGGVGSAFGWVAALTWLAERAPEERRGEMIGTLLSAAVVGALLGPVLGGAAATVGIAPAFASVSCAGLAVAVWALLTPGPSPRLGKPLREVLGAARQPQLLTGLAFIAFSPLLFGALAVLAPLQLSRLGWGAAAIGAVFLVAAVFEATVHPLLGRWSDRSGYRPPVLAGVLGSVAVLLVLPWAEYALLVALLVVLAAVAFNAPLVPGTSLLSRGAEKAGIGGAPAFGATNFAWASGYAAGSFLGGSLADIGGDVLSYLTLAAVCLFTMLLLRRS
jgi:MFS family permease